MIKEAIHQNRMEKKKRERKANDVSLIGLGLY
jgi:hypothetical protein